MAVSRAMRRLLQVLEIQEEECRAALESARAELMQFENALKRARERERAGRHLVQASAAGGDVADRIAGLEETRIAKRLAVALAARIAEAELAVDARQREFLAKRIERRQTETLIAEAEAQETFETNRRTQRGLDDWYLGRRRRPEHAPREATLENPHGHLRALSQKTQKT